MNDKMKKVEKEPTLAETMREEVNNLKPTDSPANDMKNIQNVFIGILDLVESESE